MARKTVNVSVTRLTENKGELRPSIKVYEGKAKFSVSYNFCYLNDRTLQKIKGGAGHGKGGNYGGGGNYVGVEDEEVYRVSQDKT